MLTQGSVLFEIASRYQGYGDVVLIAIAASGRTNTFKECAQRLSGRRILSN